MFGDHGLCGLLEEGTHEKSPKCLGGNLGDFGEFCKGLRLKDSDGLFLIQILLSIPLIPKVTPYKAWKGKNQVEADNGRVKLPILGMHGSGA